MDYKETINYLRKAKNVKVDDIIGSNISHSQYHRFINGESDISLEKFMYILSKLNVQIEEFIFLTDYNELTNVNDYMFKIRTAFEQRNDKSLTKISEELEKLFKDTNIDKYNHLESLCNVLIKRLAGVKEAIDGSKIQNYLFEVEVWTHYEIVLFNNTFFLFDPEVVRILLGIVKKRFVKFNDYSPHVRELVSLFSNIIIYIIQHQGANKALYVIDELDRINVKPEHVYELTIIKFWKSVKECLIGNSKARTEIAKIIDFLEFIGDNHLKSLFNNLVSYLDIEINR